METVRTTLGYVAGASMREAIRKVLELWKQTDPVEVQNWLKDIRVKRQTLHDEKGFSHSREFMHLCSVPQFVHLWIGRLTGDPDWVQNDPKLLEILLDELPEARVNQDSGAHCAADRS